MASAIPSIVFPIVRNSCQLYFTIKTSKHEKNFIRLIYPCHVLCDGTGRRTARTSAANGLRTDAWPDGQAIPGIRSGTDRCTDRQRRKHQPTADGTGTPTGQLRPEKEREAQEKAKLERLTAALGDEQLAKKVMDYDKKNRRPGPGGPGGMMPPPDGEQN